MEIIASGDFNSINFEAPIPPPHPYHQFINKILWVLACMIEWQGFPKSGPSLSQDNEGPKWLEANGFGIVSVANNHIMDYGEGAMEYTKSSFSSSLVFGAGSWTEAYSPCIIDKDGAKAAIWSTSTPYVWKNLAIMTNLWKEVDI